MNWVECLLDLRDGIKAIFTLYIDYSNYQTVFLNLTLGSAFSLVVNSALRAADEFFLVDRNPGLERMSVIIDLSVKENWETRYSCVLV